MLLIYGVQKMGSVDQVDNLFSVKTNFIHIYYVPLLPIGTHLVLKSGESVSLGLNLKSIFTAYFRFACFLAFIIGVGGVAISSSPLFYLSMLAIGIALFILSCLLKGWGKATYEKACWLVKRADLGPRVETHVEYAFGNLSEKEFQTEASLFPTAGEIIEKKLGFNPIFVIGGLVALLAVASITFKAMRDSSRKNKKNNAQQIESFAEIPSDLRTLDQCLNSLDGNDDERITFACKKLRDPELLDESRKPEVSKALMDLAGRAEVNEEAVYKALQKWVTDDCFTELQKRLEQSPRKRRDIGAVFLASNSPKVAKYLSPSLKPGYNIVRKFRQLGPESADGMLAGICGWQQPGTEAQAAILLKGWEIDDSKTVKQVFYELESEIPERRTAAIRLLANFNPQTSESDKKLLANYVQRFIENSTSERNQDVSAGWEALGGLQLPETYPSLVEALLESNTGAKEGVRKASKEIEEEVHRQLKENNLWEDPPEEVIDALMPVGGQKTMDWLQSLRPVPDKAIRTLEHFMRRRE